MKIITTIADNKFLMLFFVFFCYTQKNKNPWSFPSPKLSGQRRNMMMTPEKKRVYPPINPNKAVSSLHSICLINWCVSFFFNSPQKYGWFLGYYEFCQQLYYRLHWNSLMQKLLLNVPYDVRNTTHCSICVSKNLLSCFAGILIITGFSFFGKNFYNSLPIIIGASQFCKNVTRIPFREVATRCFLEQHWAH